MVLTAAVAVVSVLWLGAAILLVLAITPTMLRLFVMKEIRRAGKRRIDARYCRGECAIVRMLTTVTKTPAC